MWLNLENNTQMQPTEPLKIILHLILIPCETSMAYNEFPLVQYGEYDVSICSFFPKEEDIEVPAEIKLFEGNGNIFYYFRLMRQVLNGNEYDVIHIHNVHQGFLFLFFLIFHKNHSRNTVFTFHNSFHNYKFRNKLLLILNYVFQDNFVFCSKASEKNFPTWLINLRSKKRKIFTIPNGVNVERIHKTLQPNEATLINRGDEMSILSIGRLIPIKNPEMILDVLAGISTLNWKMNFLGDGFLREALEKRINQNDIFSDRITLHGIVPREEVYRIASNSDLFLSTSHGEGLPIAVLEALACGCYGILSDIEPHREIARGNDFIKLCDPDKPHDFIRAIFVYNALSRDEKERIKNSISEYIRNSFSLEKMQKLYKDVYFG